ncbi:uncharacterized protein LOC125369047 [Ricinus communis]|uniref:uncharacterized protein LOC125369047 n=1 Tax=Ricinus communis TaxID=3988 RepID=UPI00201AC26C|nr:uncharacterized protein LOC125369047 [Ricinus communis]
MMRTWKGPNPVDILTRIGFMLWAVWRGRNELIFSWTPFIPVKIAKIVKFHEMSDSAAVAILCRKATGSLVDGAAVIIPCLSKEAAEAKAILLCLQLAQNLKLGSFDVFCEKQTSC